MPVFFIDAEFCDCSLGFRIFALYVYCYHTVFTRGDANVRSIADFEVPDFLVCLPSFKMFRSFLLIKFKTRHPV